MKFVDLCVKPFKLFTLNLKGIHCSYDDSDLNLDKLQRINRSHL